LGVCVTFVKLTKVCNLQNCKLWVWVHKVITFFRSFNYDMSLGLDILSDDGDCGFQQMMGIVVNSVSMEC
jgi:hypothetical protein